jgi:hypothetical protein
VQLHDGRLAMRQFAKTFLLIRDHLNNLLTVNIPRKYSQFTEYKPGVLICVDSLSEVTIFDLKTELVVATTTCHQSCGKIMVLRDKTIVLCKESTIEVLAGGKLKVYDWGHDVGHVAEIGDGIIGYTDRNVVTELDLITGRRLRHDLEQDSHIFSFVFDLE